MEESVVLPPRAPLPPGVKNYITPAGAERLRRELEILQQTPGEGQKTSLREARIRQLQEIIPSLVPAERPGETSVARFGAKVSIQRSSGEVEVYRLVGVDETDLDRNEISWLSPLAKVLMGKRAGDRVPFRSPVGVVEFKITDVTYD